MMNKIYTGIIYTGLTILMVFAPLARGATNNRLWATTIVLFLIYTVVFAGLLKNVNQGKGLGFSQSRGGHWTGLSLPFIGLVSVSIISFAFSIYKYESFYALLKFLGYAGLYYVVVSNYTRRLMWYLVTVSIVIAAGLSIYGLLQYFGVLAHDWWVPKEFLSASYVNHNHFAGYIEMVVPIVLGLGLSLFTSHNRKHSRRVSWLLLFSFVLAVMLTAFIFSQSRGAWVCLALSLLIMNVFLIRRKLLKAYSLFIFILIMAGMLFYLYYSDSNVSQRVGTMVDIAQGEASMGTRMDIWQGTIKMIADKPLTGVGAGCFEWGFPKYRSESLGKALIRPRYAHNDYLHLASELGVFGLIFMVWILVVLVSRGIRRLDARARNSKEVAVNYVILACGIGLLSLSLHGLVDFNFNIPANMILFIILAAIVSGEHKNNVKNRG